MKQLDLVPPKAKKPIERAWSLDPFVLEESKGMTVLRSEPFCMTEEKGSATLVIPWQKAASRHGDNPPNTDLPGLIQSIIKQTSKKRQTVAYRIWNGSWSRWQST